MRLRLVVSRVINAGDTPGIVAYYIAPVVVSRNVVATDTAYVQEYRRDQEYWYPRILTVKDARDDNTLKQWEDRLLGGPNRQSETFAQICVSIDCPPAPTQGVTAGYVSSFNIESARELINALRLHNGNVEGYDQEELAWYNDRRRELNLTYRLCALLSQSPSMSCRTDPNKKCNEEHHQRLICSFSLLQALEQQRALPEHPRSEPRGGGDRHSSQGGHPASWAPCSDCDPDREQGFGPGAPGLGPTEGRYRSHARRRQAGARIDARPQRAPPPQSACQTRVFASVKVRHCRNVVSFIKRHHIVQEFNMI